MCADQTGTGTGTGTWTETQNAQEIWVHTGVGVDVSHARTVEEGPATSSYQYLQTLRVAHDCLRAGQHGGGRGHGGLDCVGFGARARADEPLPRGGERSRRRNGRGELFSGIRSPSPPPTPAPPVSHTGWFGSTILPVACWCVQCLRAQERGCTTATIPTVKVPLHPLDP